MLPETSLSLGTCAEWEMGVMGVEVWYLPPFRRSSGHTIGNSSGTKHSGTASGVKLEPGWDPGVGAEPGW